MSTAAAAQMNSLTTNICAVSELASRLPQLEAFLRRQSITQLTRHPAWPLIFQESMSHRPYHLEVRDGPNLRGFLQLAYIKGLFGRFLVSLPYVNYGGVVAEDHAAAQRLLQAARELADDLDVRYLELRHETPITHDSLTASRKDKVHMRLDLPDSPEKLWKGLNAKVRNQVRKAEKSELAVTWAGPEGLGDFFAVFSRNMRDLGTPVFSRNLFRAILSRFGERAEFCLVRAGGNPVAAALLLHGWGITEVPSASSLRAYNHTCANMLMYRHLLDRTIERGQRAFDFGRSSLDSNTYRFKAQWGATPCQAEWQYYVRKGSVGEMRTDNPRYQRLIRTWQRLPVWLTRLIGPRIVRGIP